VGLTLLIALNADADRAVEADRSPLSARHCPLAARHVRIPRLAPLARDDGEALPLLGM